MNEELNKTLVEILNATKEGVTNIALVVQQQAPELAKEIVSYGSVMYGIEFFIFLGLLISYFLYLPKTIAMHKEDNELGFPLFYFIIGGLIVLVLFVGVLSCFEKLLMALFAPKLFIIDYIKGFIK